MSKNTHDELDSILKANPAHSEVDSIIGGKPVVADPEREAHLQKAQAYEAEAVKYKKGPEVSKTEAFIGGAGKGMLDMYRGIGVRTAQGLEKVGLVEGDTINKYLKGLQDESKTYQKISSQHPISSGIGEALGGAAALPVPPIVKAGQLGSGVIGAGLRGAANFGLAGAAMGAADVNNADKPLLEAAAGGALPAAAIGGGLGMAGKMIGGGIKAALRPENSVMEQQALEGVAKETGLKPTFGEISQSPSGLSAERFTGGLPLNKMRDYKFESAAAMEPSVKKFTDQMAGKWANVPESSFINQLEGMKGTVKAKTDELYNAATAAAKAEKLTPNVEPIKNFLTDQIGFYKELPGKDAKRLVGELTDQLGHVKNLDYGKVDYNVKYLSNLAFKKFKQSENGTALPDEYKIYYKLRDTYLDSLDSPNASVDVKAAMNTARQFYKTEMVPFQDPKLQQFMGQEIAFDKFLKSMTDKAKAGADMPFFQKLDQDTQQLLRKDFLTFVRQDATKADGTLDMGKFIQKLNSYSALKPQIFGDETKKFESYAKLLGYMKPQQDLHNTNMLSGGTLGGIGAGIAAVTYPSTAAVILPASAALWAYSRMSTSESGRRILGNLTKMTDKTAQPIKDALEQQGKNHLKQLIKTIPSMYMRNTNINAMQQKTQGAR